MGRVIICNLVNNMQPFVAKAVLSFELALYLLLYDKMQHVLVLTMVKMSNMVVHYIYYIQ